MKRSRSLVLTGLMAAGGVSLTACERPNYDSARNDRGQDAWAYASLAECKAKGEVPADACEKAEQSAKDDDSKSARYDNQATCEDVYGEGQCVPRSYAGGHGGFWGPLLAGFVVGRMMDGGWGGRSYYYNGGGGGYFTASGAPVWRDYATGRTRVAAGGFSPPDAYGPAKVMSRTGAISRGGFGGRMSSRSFGGGFHSFGG